jgi:hypothetical protein
MSASTVETFFARIDARLAQLDPQGRSDFLANLTEQWLERYRDFQFRIDRGAPTRSSMTAWDYVETISGIEQRAAQTPTDEVMDDLRRWQEAHRSNRAFHARENV